MLFIRAARLASGRTASAGGIGLVLALVLAGTAARAGQGATAGPADEPRVTVLNPTGIAPAIQRRSMSARPASLDGRTVYLVDVTFNGGDVFLQQMQRWMAANLPTVKTEFRIKRGVYAADDPALWKEIQAVNGLMIMAIGH